MYNHFLRTPRSENDTLITDSPPNETLVSLEHIRTMPRPHRTALLLQLLLFLNHQSNAFLLTPRPQYFPPTSSTAAPSPRRRTSFLSNRDDSSSSSSIPPDDKDEDGISSSDWNDYLLRQQQRQQEEESKLNREGIRDRVKKWWKTRGSTTPTGDDTTTPITGEEIDEKERVRRVREEQRQRRQERVLEQLRLEVGEDGYEEDETLRRTRNVAKEPKTDRSMEGTPTLEEMMASIEKQAKLVEERRKEMSEVESPRDRFLRMEQDMRSKVGLTSKSETTRDDPPVPQQQQQPMESPAEEQPPEQPTLSQIQREETPQRRYERMQQDMRDKMGMTTRPESDDDSSSEPPPTLPSDDPSQIRTELSSKGIQAAEQLKWKKKRHVQDLIDKIEGVKKGISEQPEPPVAEQPPPSPPDEVPPSQELTDESFRMPQKKATVSEQMYRMLAAKGGNKDVSDSQKLNEWDAFLKKEQDMRAKMDAMRQSPEEEDEGSANELPPTSRTEPLIPSEDGPSPFESIEELVSDEYQLRSTPSSVSDQIYRSIAATRTGKDKITKESFDAFYRKELEMRQRMNMTTVEDEEDDDKETLSMETSNEGYLLDHEHDLHREGDDVIPREKEDYSDQVEMWIKSHKNVTQVDDTTTERVVQQLPDTPFFQDASPEIEEDEEEVMEEEPIPPRPIYPSETSLSDLFQRTPDDEVDFYLTRGLNSFSGFSARKTDMIDQPELEVSELNALLDHDPMARLAMINKPDSAFGAIFRLEGLLLDMTKLHSKVWTKVAEKFEYDEPDWDYVQLAQLKTPEEAVKTVFHWTFDRFEAMEIGEYAEQILSETLDEWMKRIPPSNPANFAYTPNFHEEETPLFEVSEGAIPWLENLERVEIPCALITHISNTTQLNAILNATSLDRFFDPSQIVLSTQYEIESQEFLGAALRIERRPDHCVVYDTTPSSAAAAHDVKMKNVALMGLHALWELNSADIAVSDWEELSVVNVRRLFGDEDFEMTELELEVERPKTRRWRRWAEGDRD